MPRNETYNSTANEIAKEWLDLIVKNINKVMQDEDRLLLQDSVSFLISTLEKNNI